MATSVNPVLPADAVNGGDANITNYLAATQALLAAIANYMSNESTGNYRALLNAYAEYSSDKAAMKTTNELACVQAFEDATTPVDAPAGIFDQLLTDLGTKGVSEATIMNDVDFLNVNKNENPESQFYANPSEFQSNIASFMAAWKQ